jgi:hypothetical protein
MSNKRQPNAERIRAASQIDKMQERMDRQKATIDRLLTGCLAMREGLVRIADPGSEADPALVAVATLKLCRGYLGSNFYEDSPDTAEYTAEDVPDGVANQDDDKEE